MEKTVEQFRKRAGTYSGSAQWISDPLLIQAHLEACGATLGHVLELCCGTGMVGRNLRAAGWSVMGMDLTREMAEEANRYFPCICAPAEKNPFLDGAFDAVVLRQAYFLLEDGQEVLAQARRVLKDGGVMVLSQTVPFSKEDAPHLEHIHRAKQAQLRFFHTEETLTRELEKAGFGKPQVRRLTVRENVTRWMAEAPELSPAKREEVCRLVAASPPEYHTRHRVEVRGDEVFEDWNWVLLSAGKR